VVEPNARLGNFEAGRPNDNVEIEFAAVLRDEPGLGDTDEGVRNEVHVIALERSEPAGIVCGRNEVRKGRLVEGERNEQATRLQCIG
jgi:hypothetical protein